MLVYDITRGKLQEICNFDVDLDGMLADRCTPADYADQLLTPEQMNEWGLPPEWYLFTLSTPAIVFWQVVAFLCHLFA